MSQMRKVKPSPKTRNKTPKPAAHKSVSRGAPSPRESKAYSEEYADYLTRYKLYGSDRPHLSPAEFDRLDDEMLDLLGVESEIGLNDEQIVRLQELEFLLLDSEQ